MQECLYYSILDKLQKKIIAIVACLALCFTAMAGVFFGLIKSHANAASFYVNTFVRTDSPSFEAFSWGGVSTFTSMPENWAARSIGSGTTSAPTNLTTAFVTDTTDTTATTMTLYQGWDVPARSTCETAWCIDDRHHGFVSVSGSSASWTLTGDLGPCTSCSTGRTMQSAVFRCNVAGHRSILSYGNVCSRRSSCPGNTLSWPTTGTCRGPVCTTSGHTWPRTWHTRTATVNLIAPTFAVGTLVTTGTGGIGAPSWGGQTNHGTSNPGFPNTGNGGAAESRGNTGWTLNLRQTWTTTPAAPCPSGGLCQPLIFCSFGSTREWSADFNGHCSGTLSGGSTHGNSNYMKRRQVRCSVHGRVSPRSGVSTSIHCSQSGCSNVHSAQPLNWSTGCSVQGRDSCPGHGTETHWHSRTGTATISPDLTHTGGGTNSDPYVIMNRAGAPTGTVNISKSPDSTTMAAPIFITDTIRAWHSETASRGNRRFDLVRDVDGAVLATINRTGTNGTANANAAVFPLSDYGGETLRIRMYINGASDGFAQTSFIQSSLFIVVAYHTVTFNPNGGLPAPPSQSVLDTTGRVTEPPDLLTKGGAIFSHWVMSTIPEVEFDFENTPVTSSMTLDAIWVTVNSGLIRIHYAGGPTPITFNVNDPAPTIPALNGTTFFIQTRFGEIQLTDTDASGNIIVPWQQISVSDVKNGVAIVRIFAR